MPAGYEVQEAWTQLPLACYALSTVGGKAGRA